MSLATAVVLGAALYVGLAALVLVLGVRWARDALGVGPASGPRP